jgi:hypothetical protein
MQHSSHHSLGHGRSLELLKGLLRLAMLLCMAGVAVGMVVNRPYLFVLSLLGMGLGASGLVWLCSRAGLRRTRRSSSSSHCAERHFVKALCRLTVGTSLVGVPASLIWDRSDLLVLSVIGMGLAGVFLLQISKPGSLTPVRHLRTPSEHRGSASGRSHHGRKDRESSQGTSIEAAWPLGW